MGLKIYVSGSKIVWEDGANIYGVTGAQPTPTPSGFSSQPVGRIWVATQDRLLWYSDQSGNTRFVRGIGRGATARPNGLIFANRGSCPTTGSLARDLWWISSGSYNSVRADTAPTPVYSVLTLSYNLNGATLDGYYIGTLSNALDTSVTMEGSTITSYGDSTCGGGAVGGASGAGLTVTIPAGDLYMTSSTFNLGDGDSYSVNLSGFVINSTPRVHNETFCVNNNTVNLTLDYTISASCVGINTGSGAQFCTEECVPGSDDPNFRCIGTDGCVCNPVPVYDGVSEWIHYCYDPESGGGGGGGGCGQFCEENAECGAECPQCTGNMCSSEEPE